MLGLEERPGGIVRDKNLALFVFLSDELFRTSIYFVLGRGFLRRGAEFRAFLFVTSIRRVSVSENLSMVPF